MGAIRSLSAAQQDEFIRDYLGKMKIGDIAKKYGITRETVNRLSIRLGIQRQPMDLEKVKSMLLAGGRKDAIAKELGVTVKQLSNFMYTHHLHTLDFVLKSTSKTDPNLYLDKSTMSYKRRVLESNSKEPFECTRETISQCYYASCEGSPTCCYLSITHHSRAYPSTDILHVSPPSACTKFISKDEAVAMGMEMMK